MWQLKMTERGGAWVTVGSFETVTAAARQIIEFEGYPVSGVFFEILIDPNAGTEEEAFTYLEHTGRRTNSCYVVKRVAH